MARTVSRRRSTGRRTQTYRTERREKSTPQLGRRCKGGGGGRGGAGEEEKWEEEGGEQDSQDGEGRRQEGREEAVGPQLRLGREERGMRGRRRGGGEGMGRRRRVEGEEEEGRRKKRRSTWEKRMKESLHTGSKPWAALGSARTSSKSNWGGGGGGGEVEEGEKEGRRKVMEV